MGLRSESDGKIILYRYDEWGRMTGLLNENGSMVETEEPAALFNPLRFRGYVYDEETGWYYLNSRYYDPTTGRFLNPDSIMGGVGSLKEYNLFAYSFNSPISFADGTGTYPIEVGQDSNRMKRDYSSVYSRKGPNYKKVDEFIGGTKAEGSSGARNIHLPEDKEGLLYTDANRWYASVKLKEKFGEETNRTVEDIYSEIFAHQFLTELTRFSADAPHKSIVGLPTLYYFVKKNVYDRAVEVDINENEGNIEIFNIMEKLLNEGR